MSKPFFTPTEKPVQNTPSKIISPKKEKELAAKFVESFVNDEAPKKSWWKK